MAEPIDLPQVLEVLRPGVSWGPMAQTGVLYADFAALWPASGSGTVPTEAECQATWDSLELNRVAVLLAAQRTAALTAYLNDPSVLARVGRAITIVLAKEINVIRAAFCKGTASGAWDPPSIANGAGATSPNLTVAGATFGTDVVDVANPYYLQGLTANGSVSAANTVVIRLTNNTGAAVNLGLGTWGVAVRRPAFAPPYDIQDLLDAVTDEIQVG